MSRIYFHIDLNAFFANAEILINPELKGKPIAVSGISRRSVVSTASYEARKFGVHSAMPIAEAQKLCSDLIVVPGHYSWYTELSNDFIKIIRSYTDNIEQASIDECYADMTEAIAKFSKPLDLAFQLQKRVLTELGLPCSIGIGPNMFLAKMASDMKKPMGITVLRIRDVPAKMWPLPIGEMRGIGNKTVPLLEAIGIHTIGDLARYEVDNQLRQIFGKNTDEMKARVNGYDNRQIIKEWDAKSMGISQTLIDDITDYDEIRGIFRSLCRTLSKRMRNDLKAGHVISIRIRYYDFHNCDRSVKLQNPIWRSDDLYMQSINLFDNNWTSEAIRLLGVSVSDFDAGNMMQQTSLFDIQNAEKEETRHVLYDLNTQMKKDLFCRASDLLKAKK